MFTTSGNNLKGSSWSTDRHVPNRMRPSAPILVTENARKFNTPRALLREDCPRLAAQPGTLNTLAALHVNGVEHVVTAEGHHVRLFAVDLETGECQDCGNGLNLGKENAVLEFEKNNIVF